MHGEDAIVLDCGTATIKAGLASSHLTGPTVLIPAASGEDEDGGSCSPAVDSGVVRDWVAMERLWRRAVLNLGTQTNEHRVLLVERPHQAEEQRRLSHERTAELMFESLEVPELGLASSAIAAITAASSTANLVRVTDAWTGVVLDSGEGVTQAMPVHRGKVLHDTIVRIEVGGSTITDRLVHTLMTLDSPSALSSASSVLAKELASRTERHHRLAFARDLKEKLSFVPIDAADFEMLQQLDQGPTQSYVLPDDGSTVDVAHNELWRYEGPESLFAPSSVGIEGYDGLQWTLDHAVSKCDMSIRRDLWENVILCGGNTMIDGYVDRMKRELNGVVTSGYRTRLVAPPDRQFTVWRGGAMLAQKPGAQGAYWITKKQYEESGKFP